MKRTQLYHDTKTQTGAQRFLTAFSEDVVFDPIDVGGTAYVYEVTIYDRRTGNVLFLREHYPTQQLRDIGAHYWRAHPRYSVVRDHKRTATTTQAMVHPKVPAADTLDGHEPETLDYDIAPGESALDAYRRHLDEQ